MIYGTIAEMFIFTFGLVYKIHRENIKKNNLEKLAFNQYTKTLRAQMNPHFIFNSLNSIKYYALAKSTSETADYITDFANK